MANFDKDERYPVDFIFPYVDSSDPVWQKTAKKVHERHGRPFNPNSQRFREWDNIVFIFRGIERYMPWIRKVHLIVACPSQVPRWLNKECPRLNIIYHKDFIPRAKRPTFNSCTIESCFPYIFTKDPEVLREFGRGPIDIADHVIYSNDDLFPVGGPMEKSDFFRAGYPCHDFRRVPYNSSQNVYRHQLAQSCSLVSVKMFNTFVNGYLYKAYHSVTPMTRSTILKVQDALGDELLENMTTFREPRNTNQTVFFNYDLFSGQYVRYRHPSQYVNFQDFSIGEICDYIRNGADGRNGKCLDGRNKGMILCINDSGAGCKYNLYKHRIRKAMEENLGEPSCFEL